MQRPALSAILEPAQAPSADVTLTMVAPFAVAPDSDFIYHLTAGNSGPDIAAGILITDTLPAGLPVLSLTPISGPTFSCNAVLSNFSCTLVTLAVNEDAVFDVLTHSLPTTNTLLRNVATIAAVTTDPNPSNNFAAAETNICDCGATVPEPSSLVLIAGGLVVLIRPRKCRRIQGGLSANGTCDLRLSGVGLDKEAIENHIKVSIASAVPRAEREDEWFSTFR